MELMESLKLKGQSTVRIWKRGVLERFMQYSVDLREAQSCAMLAGALIDENTVNNLVVSVGKTLVCDMLIDDEDTGLTYHAIGSDNTTPAVADTTLTAEEARKLWTSRSRAGNQITLSVFYTAAECGYDIKEAGVFGSATASGAADSGVMFSHYLQTYDNSGGEYDLTFDYVLTIG